MSESVEQLNTEHANDECEYYAQHEMLKCDVMERVALMYSNEKLSQKNRIFLLEIMSIQIEFYEKMQKANLKFHNNLINNYDLLCIFVYLYLDYLKKCDGFLKITEKSAGISLSPYFKCGNSEENLTDFVFIEEKKKLSRTVASCIKMNHEWFDSNIFFDAQENFIRKNIDAARRDAKKGNLHESIKFLKEFMDKTAKYKHNNRNETPSEVIEFGEGHCV